MVNNRAVEMFPIFFKWSGGGIVKDSWALGWWTGPDEDLLCVRPNISSPVLAEITLSPTCSNRFYAIISFLMKRCLLVIDQNLQRIS